MIQQKRVIYTYDDYGRLNSVTNNNSSNQFWYVNGKLDTITANGTNYKLEYDDYDRLIKIDIANQNKIPVQTLMTYSYNEFIDIYGNQYQTNQIGTEQYGNGDSYLYNYDDENRIKEIWFKKENESEYTAQFSFDYNIDNTIYCEYDYINDVHYNFTYDNAGRVKEIIDKNGNKVDYNYDEIQGDFNSFTTTINGQTRETDYNYDYSNNLYDNTVVKDKDGNTLYTKKYSYEFPFQRLFIFMITYGTNEVFDTSYYYDDSNVVNGTSTYRIKRRLKFQPQIQVLEIFHMSMIV